MDSVERAKADLAKAQALTAEVKRKAHNKLVALHHGRTGKRLLDAVGLAEVAYGPPFVLSISQKNDKLELSINKRS